MLKCATWDERLDLGSKLIKHLNTQEMDYQKAVANSIYKRSKALMTYIPRYSKMKSNIKLIKPINSGMTSLPEDYGLSEYFEKPVEIHKFKGDHVTILENKAVAEVINSSLRQTDRT